MKDNSNISQELLETVERYYNSTMSIEERKAFEEKLQEDATFKATVEDIKSLIMGIEAQSLKEQLNEFHKELPLQAVNEVKHPKVRFLLFKKIAAAAVVVMALGSVWYYVDSSNERFYNNHFQPDPGLPTTMSSTDNFAFYDAMVNYKQKHYKKAIKKWEVLYARAPQNDTLNYFLGVSHLADDNENEAIPYLERVIGEEDSAFKNEAYYYLGFVYLKKEDIPSAKTNFRLSSLEEAKTILAQLKD